VPGEIENRPRGARRAAAEPAAESTDGLVRNPYESGDTPVVLVPVSAEYVAGRRRRIFMICWSAALLAVGTAGYLYKRSVDPIHAQESYDAGVRLLKIARYSQAILSFDRAIALKPDLIDAYLERGRAFVGDSQTERAIQDFTRVIELRPNDPQPLIDRGMAHIEQKDYQAAIADADKALGIDPKAAAAFNLRGVAHRAMGNLDGALRDFGRAVDLASNETNYYERGATYQLLGEHRRAIADFSQVIAFRPDASAGYFARAQSLRAIGDLQGAEQDYLQGRIIDGR
jgi:tetratricopeptide (TPR) repeat protein